MDGLPLVNTPYLVFLIACVYLYVVLKLGPDFMKNRPAYNLKTVIQMYNVSQIFFNVFLIYTVSPFEWMDNNFKVIKYFYTRDLVIC